MSVDYTPACWSSKQLRRGVAGDFLDCEECRRVPHFSRVLCARNGDFRQSGGLLFINLRFFHLRVRLQTNFGNLGFAQLTIQRGQVCALEFIPAL